MNYNLSLQDYLKKFSSISNKFIDDFFSLYDENTKDTTWEVTEYPETGRFAIVC